MCKYVAQDGARLCKFMDDERIERFLIGALTQQIAFVQ
jgi:hypothetical protein